MLNCRELEFSLSLSAKRIKKAQSVLGDAIVARLLAFAFYLMGVKQNHIAKALGMPLETTRSLNRRIHTTGIGALQDRRRSDCGHPVQPPANTPQLPVLRINLPDAGVLEIKEGSITIPQKNTVQRKVVLLSMIGKGMLSTEQVAEALGLSVQHVRKMHRDLMAIGIDGVTDKRRGQLQDYRVNNVMKGRIIAEFVLALAEAGSVTSIDVAERMAAQYDEQVAERTIRHHLKNMGIQAIKGHLLSGLAFLKKTPDNNR